MSVKTLLLENLLARKGTAKPNLASMNGKALKSAARFWIGKSATQMSQLNCQTALAELFQDPVRIDEAMKSLDVKERQLLAVVRRYDSVISRSLLRAEATARGFVKKTVEQDYFYSRREPDDAIDGLAAKFLLLTVDGRAYDNRDSGYSHFGRTYPDYYLNSGLVKSIASISPLPWQSSAPAARPTTTYFRRPVTAAIDLARVAQHLTLPDHWQMNMNGSPSKNMWKKMQKKLFFGEPEPLAPPDLDAFYFALLRSLGIVTARGVEGKTDLDMAEFFFGFSEVEQSWNIVRAWMKLDSWQDGRGGIEPEHRSSGNSAMTRLQSARELLVWALCRAAHIDNAWLDLEVFLLDLHEAIDRYTMDISGHGTLWKPHFHRTEEMDKQIARPGDRHSQWMDSTGVWAANAILGTFAHFGLIERGHAGHDAKDRPCFRLTETGRAVFGAPEVAVPNTAESSACLALQPNFDILVYMDQADSSAVWPLARMARRTSTASWPVQTFGMTHDTVYEGMESGLTSETIQSYFANHSKNGLPSNVARSILEWGQKRDSLVLRSGICLAVGPSAESVPLRTSAKAKAVGDRFALLPGGASRGFKGCSVIDHNQKAKRDWHVDEDGLIRLTDKADMIALAYLSQFADFDENCWHITAASVRRAKDRSISADEILGLIDGRLDGEIPPFLKVAISNWSKPTKVFFGKLLLLQVADIRTGMAIAASSRFKPLFVEQIAPEWFIVRAEKQAEMKQLLVEMGFVPDSVARLVSMDG